MSPPVLCEGLFKQRIRWFRMSCVLFTQHLTLQRTEGGHEEFHCCLQCLLTTTPEWCKTFVSAKSCFPCGMKAPCYSWLWKLIRCMKKNKNNQAGSSNDTAFWNKGAVLSRHPPPPCQLTEKICWHLLVFPFLHSSEVNEVICRQECKAV